MSDCWFYASRLVSLNFLFFVPHRTDFWDGVTCRVGFVIPKGTRAAQECDVNMNVIEKQMLEFEQHMSVSGLCPVVHFTIISIGHMISFTQGSVNFFFSFYVHGTVHHLSVLNKPTRSSVVTFISPVDYSTCFGRFLHPSSGV